MSGKNIKFDLFTKIDYDDLKEEYTYLEDSMFEEYGSRDDVEQAEEVNRKLNKMKTLIQKVIEYLDTL